jgi:hypothetical protein
MKASELIHVLIDLAAEHGDLEVMTEGCDCNGDSRSVELRRWRTPIFMICRTYEGVVPEPYGGPSHDEILQEKYPGMLP